MAKLRNDDELVAILKDRLFTAVVGDVMDQLGFRTQFLPPYIRPLRTDTKIAGRAMPVLDVDALDDERPDPPNPMISKPFGLMLEALDDLKPGEIYVASGPSGAYAMWGELMATRAVHLKAAGAVLDGYVRDAAGIEALNFPTFSKGLYAQDQGVRGKVIDFRTTIRFGDAIVEPGAMMFGDREGVLVMPRGAEADIVHLALKKVTDENEVARAIEGGMSTVEAFDKYGVM